MNRYYFAVRKINYLVVGLLRDLAQSPCSNIFDAKFLGCVYVLWFRNTAKRDVSLSTCVVSNRPIGLTPIFKKTIFLCRLDIEFCDDDLVHWYTPTDQFFSVDSLSSVVFHKLCS